MDSWTKCTMSSCALLSVDMQNDFVLPTGSMCTQGALEMIPRLSALMDLFRQKQLPIVHIVRLYQADGAGADNCRRERLEKGESLVVAGSGGAQIVEGLLSVRKQLDAPLLLSGQPQPVGEDEYIIYKPRWSAFFGTRLHQFLQARGVTTVAVAGTWYPNCIHATIYEATALDYRVVALRDCIAGLTQKDCNDLEMVAVSVQESAALFRE